MFHRMPNHSVLFAALALAGCGSPDPAGSGGPPPPNSGGTTAAGGSGAGGSSGSWTGGTSAGGASGAAGAASGGSAGAASGGSAGAASGGSGGDGGQAGGASSGGSAGAGGATKACAAGAAGPTSAAFQTSGPINAVSGKTYTGLKIQNPNGPCITLDGVSNVVISDSEIGPCGGGAAIVVSGASHVTIERAHVHHSARGVLAQSSSDVKTLKSVFDHIDGEFPEGTAIEYDYMAGGGTIADNCISGSFGSDVISGFESSNLKIVGNEVHATITEPSAAGFTIGDSVNGSPGHDNYVAKNVVHQTGGVPPGVFGSSGNTLLELNCLPTGIQAYAYNGPFVGVTVKNNVIGPGSFVPDPSVVQGWNTNTFTSDGSGCP